jgi:hypothetical protein
MGIVRFLSTACLTLALACMTVSAASASSRSPAPQTKRWAELKVINATGRLRKLNVPFFDQWRNALPTNTHVSCAGRGRPSHHRYRTFICALAYGGQTVRVKYVVLRGGHFRLLRLR